MTLSSVTPYIDLSAIPAPAIIEPIHFEVLLAARMARLKVRMAEQGFAYDVEGLETDPAKILQEEDAYRQMLDRQRVNDALRAVLPACASGSDLDAIALRAGVVRQVIEVRTASDGQQISILETDERLRQRYLAAFGRPAAGSVDGYIYAALTAWPKLHDVAVLGPEIHDRPGYVEVILLLLPDELMDTHALQVVNAAVNAKSVRPLTDHVTVRFARLMPYEVTATLSLPAGPDPQIIRNAALADLNAFATARYRIGGRGGVLPANALAAALYVPNVSRVHLAGPVADIVIPPDAAPWLINVTLALDILT